MTASATGAHQIDRLGAPLFVSWQLTRDCDLACVHCCTESAPGKPMANELSRAEALAFADEIVAAGVPYAMLCGGEPMVVPHFLEVAERLGRGGVQLKIETNGQRFGPAEAVQLAELPVRSVQISLDADDPTTYARQRPGASLEKVHAACRAVRAAGLPLEVTFAPTRVTITELPAALRRARQLGAFRFNTGALMRIGNAARNWRKLVPTAEQYDAFRAVLDREAESGEAGMELAYLPFRMEDGLRQTAAEPPATLLVLPDGRVKASAALPYIVADVRRDGLAQAWRSYCQAWHTSALREAIEAAIADGARHAQANAWQELAESTA
ncbi:radical SAM protein [Rhodovibrio salinarum]|uniref:Radical SAM protein n=1 Tax=Rhodovibrio salinarum TaxID=1087 RepID=A0A934QJ37_9PROT|nr:radical SAM protein [Rhodovibrio salinarum]MBK1697788.1 radical SAM protein [Rhodovibrio salinarum]